MVEIRINNKGGFAMHASSQLRHVLEITLRAAIALLVERKAANTAEGEGTVGGRGATAYDPLCGRQGRLPRRLEVTWIGMGSRPAQSS